MKLVFLVLLLSTSLYGKVIIRAEFPLGPEASMTPGSLCDRPDEYRYAERIPYCNRDVDSSLKKDIFNEYRLQGYRLNPNERSSYKIDHLIPLCAGGSNRENNLWPQHKSVYDRTDPLESIGCEKLKDGKIKQAQLIKKILSAKNDLSLVGETYKYLISL